MFPLTTYCTTTPPQASLPCRHFIPWNGLKLCRSLLSLEGLEDHPTSPRPGWRGVVEERATSPQGSLTYTSTTGRKSPCQGTTINEVSC